MDTPIATPEFAFDHPIEMLDHCHQRIRRSCDLLLRIAERIRSHGGDDEARDAALTVMRFFDSAGADHHRDEEDDLFPALVHHAPSLELNAVRCLVFTLSAQHAQLDTMWAAMRTHLVAIAGRRDTDLTVELAQSFAAATELHIATEEAQLLPLARRVLGEPSLARLGTSMARRRGLETGAA